MPPNLSVILGLYPNGNLLPLFHFADRPLEGLRVIIESQLLAVHFDGGTRQDWAERCPIPQLHTGKILDAPVCPFVVALTIHMDTF